MLHSWHCSYCWTNFGLRHAWWIQVHIPCIRCQRQNMVHYLNKDICMCKLVIIFALMSWYLHIGVKRGGHIWLFLYQLLSLNRWILSVTNCSMHFFRMNNKFQIILKNVSIYKNCVLLFSVPLYLVLTHKSP